MKIAIAGAGSIGCYVGACCADAGMDVAMLARARVRDEITTAGLRATDLQGRDFTVPAERLRIDEDPAVCAGADVVMVAVKSRDSEPVANSLAPHLAAGCLVASLQNGVRNAEVLGAALPGHPVAQVMVPWNVVNNGGGHFHRGTEGVLAVELPAGGALLDIFGAAGLDAKGYTDMEPVLWGKLMLNLNNAINALSDIPLRAQVSQRAYREVLARCIAEAMAACRAAGIRPARTGKIFPALLPFMLRLPDWLFRRLASTMLKMDENARSSMWEDISRGRPTEVDYLNGEIVRLAQAHGLAAPVNQRIVQLVHEAESVAGSPGLSAQQLLGAE